ncbi:hypothetical protein C943_04222 [Mariniradius saccharolyticus AK6]|uniref:Uncharacterized protein n=1 Tax=Mariniradius saccharolyticus AK6 TaxID=1239962 RepID=M7XHA2_9BACT|nr:hypothetical protein C943_04222 [Mariniradius saccharolyticus AK6]
MLGLEDWLFFVTPTEEVSMSQARFLVPRNDKANFSLVP